MLPGMAIDDLIAQARSLERAIDKAIDGAAAHGNPAAQARTDWAWYRLRSVLDFVHQRCAGPVSASLARSLLEEAAYWDWALATGVGAEHLARRASIEYQGLVRLAADVSDDVWIGWILPPGSAVLAQTDHGIPHSAADAVKRIGNGFAKAVLQPLRFRGLFAANQILDVLTHGNMAAAFVMAPGGGEELPDGLAAAVIHVAAAGAAAVAVANLDPAPYVADELAALAVAVAEEATQLHGLPLQEAPVARRPPKARRVAPFAAQSEIERMPRAAPTTNVAAATFVNAALAVAKIAAQRVRTDGGSGAAVAWSAFQLSWSQMLVFAGVVEGTIGRAVLPFAARMLLEDGARWEWLRQQAVASPSGESLRSIVADSRGHIERVRATMTSDGVPLSTVDRLLGYATDLLAADPGEDQMPPVSELLLTAYENPSGVDSARVMYSVLSQFVHATPLSLLHLQRDEFPSVTAPIYAASVEAACWGFWNVARTTLAIACDGDEQLDNALMDLTVALRSVKFEAAIWHSLG
jgi:hypothetical protein